jgi:hypothetical protein
MSVETFNRTASQVFLNKYPVLTFKELRSVGKHEELREITEEVVRAEDICQANGLAEQGSLRSYEESLAETICAEQGLAEQGRYLAELMLQHTAQAA